MLDESKTTTNRILSYRPEPVATHCPYCALQCGMTIEGTSIQPRIQGNQNFSVNRGVLCVKGWTAAEALSHQDRLLRPLKRNARGALTPVSWDEALETAAQAFGQVQKTHGRDAVAVFGGGSLTNEKAYLLGKFARVALGTANIDYNGRFCMSSAAAAANKAFGVDRGLPFPARDIAEAEVILLIGGNPAETMPPLMQYFDAQRAGGGRLIVADPRRTSTAASADLHLKLIPGSDAALANGLLHLLIREGLLNEAYIRDRTESFARAKSAAAQYWPERVERITGVHEAQLLQAAQLLGNAGSAMILTARGGEQQSQGVNNTLAFINLALALGLPGKAASGFGTITGQGNGQGGREHGQKCDQLPGYRSINDMEARRRLAEVWGVEEQAIPAAGKSAYELMNALGGEIKALFSMGFNFTVSSPHAGQVIENLKNLEFFCVSDFFLSETARYADVVFPSAQWAEESGTMTNLEGRVIRRHRVFAPPAGVHTDLEILCDLAARLGMRRSFAYTQSREVFDELRRASAGGPADYSGVTDEKIDSPEGVHWPCPSPSHPGTPRLFIDSFPTLSGRARFHAIARRPSAEEPDAEYPLYLTTGRLLAHYQTGSQTRRIAKLNAIAAEPSAELHPALAKRHGIRNGQSITLATRRGSASFKVKTTADIREDTIFVPFHWGTEKSINRLTNPALDPISRMPEFKICAVRIESSKVGTEVFSTDEHR